MSIPLPVERNSLESSSSRCKNCLNGLKRDQVKSQLRFHSPIRRYIMNLYLIFLQGAPGGGKSPVLNFLIFTENVSFESLKFDISRMNPKS